MPITREEKLLNTLATGVASGVEPITREEQYLSYIAGETYTKPDAPITRKEAFLDKIPQGGGGGGGVTIRNQNKTITENGTYTADSGYTGLGTVTVDVQASGGSDIDALIDRSITEISSDASPVIGKYLFESCTFLKKAHFPNVKYVLNDAFSKCVSLTEIYMPNFNSCIYDTTAYTGQFYQCGGLERVCFPSLKNTSNSMFQYCSKLQIVDLPSATKINRSFEYCYKFRTLILRSASVATLSSSSAFQNCHHFNGTVSATHNPDGLKDGYIYVPSALIEDYKVATNWSTFADQFRALEDYTVDGTTTGALDESKI